MKLVFSHPTANANVRAVCSGLLNAGILDSFYTSIASFPGDSLDMLSKFPPFSELRRRRFDPALKTLTHTWPWLEMGRLLSIKAGLKRFIRSERGIFSVDSVYKNLDNHVSARLRAKTKGNISAVYAYEDGAYASFAQAKKLGLKCIYELPIAYWETRKKLLAEEAERLPGWKQTLGGGIKDSPQKLEHKSMELELADMVIVPSEFVLNSLPEWSKEKIVQMAPFGSPAATQIDKNILPNHHDKNRPLRLLFAGSMGQRKGLGDLFSAIHLLNDSNIELVIMGSLSAPIEFYRKILPRFIYEPGRPNEQVLALMKTCDVFCLPSIIEGRALVMQEAMSQGLPIIITPNTGGSDLVIEGETGFMVPIRSPEAIAQKLSWFLENRSKIQGMSKRAQQHAAKYTWDNYANSITNSIKTFLN
jgi:glycosyltransferase involved in cell wall biosynthesis